MKQTLKIGFTVLVVAALTMSGIALAAQGDETAGDDTSAATEQADRAIDRLVEKLAPLVDDGTITSDQAQAVAEQLAADFGGRHRPGPRAIRGLETAAEVLGMDARELASQMRDGATLAEIAGDQTDEVIAALVGDVEEHLAQAVEDGRLTQEEADEKLAAAEERITTFVNEGPPERPAGEGPAGRGPGGPQGEAGAGAQLGI